MSDDDTATMEIDGLAVPVMLGMTVLDAARSVGIDIPTLCEHPLVKSSRPGTCRLCLVEVVSGGRPGLQPSCTMPVTAGLSVKTKSDMVYRSRRMTLELYLSEHLQECRDCPMSGDCILARLCREYDVDGLTVCAECPNRGEACLLRRGVLCLGPITHAYCGAECPRGGYPCDGCHLLVTDADTLMRGVSAILEAGFTHAEIISAAQLFSTRWEGELEMAIENVQDGTGVMVHE